LHLPAFLQAILLAMNYLETNLATIAQVAQEREDENWRFRSYLKGKDGEKIDARVHRLNSEISAKIDCTTCGNCCKTFMISVEPEELEPLAAHLLKPLAEVKENYIEQSSEGDFIVNKIPCHFLSENKCTVYDLRFSTCRDFPHLHKDGFTQRLLSVIQNYQICPIVFNVYEALKKEMDFK